MRSSVVSLKSVFIVLGTVVLSAGLALYWYFFVFNHLYEVVPGRAWRSAQLDSQELESVAKRIGLRSVINLRGEHEDRVWYQEERAVTQAMGIRQVDLKMSAYKLPRHYLLQQLIIQLDSVETPLLVHCFYGIDRAGLASVVMLLLDGDRDLDVVRAEVSVFKGVRHTNSAGRQFLRQYEAWLDARKLAHTDEVFRRWVIADYQDGRTS